MRSVALRQQRALADVAERVAVAGRTGASPDPERQDRERGGQRHERKDSAHRKDDVLLPGMTTTLTRFARPIAIGALVCIGTIGFGAARSRLEAQPPTARPARRRAKASCAANGLRLALRRVPRPRGARRRSGGAASSSPRPRDFTVGPLQASLDRERQRPDRRRSAAHGPAGRLWLGDARVADGPLRRRDPGRRRLRQDVVAALRERVAPTSVLGPQVASSPESIAQRPAGVRPAAVRELPRHRRPRHRRRSRPASRTTGSSR